MLKKIKTKIHLFYLRLIKKELKNITSFHIHPTAKVYNRKNVLLAKSSLICEYVIIRAPIALLVVGENSQVGPFSVFFTGDSGITIGNDVMISPHCVFAAGNHEYRNLDVPMIQAGGFSNGPIIIEDDVWIGANCTICDNVRIGKGAIVGANSIVNKNVNSYDIVGGVPAIKISSRIQEI